MVIELKECFLHMTEEEKKHYEEDNATNFFRYLCQSDYFKQALERLSEEDWNYLFEKFYLVTYKSLQEETPLKITDITSYLYCKLGMLLTKKDTPKHNEFYKIYEISKSLFHTRKVNDDLLLGLENTVNSNDERNLDILFRQHEEACRLRNLRDFLYQEDLKSPNGTIPSGERVAINCFNRSYEKEKKLVLEYQDVL